MSATTVLLCGVGGQGTILAADILAKVAAASGLEVKLSEIHGMSQRGGSVTTVVRFGDEVHSMVCDPGSVDRIIAFEEIEALRNLPYLSENGTLLVNAEAIPSLPVLTGAVKPFEGSGELLDSLGAHLVPAGSIAREVGNPKGTNVVLIGALSTTLPFEESVWEDVIAKRVPPKTVEANLEAFHAGRKAVS
ncbi:MAG: indolepyruvate oxidoreductase subunit beta [Coriobacteriales bacterium]